MKLIKYLIWFLFGVLLFYILNNRYYRLREKFTIGAPVFILLQDTNTGNFSFITEGNDIPVGKVQLGDKYDIELRKAMLLSQTNIGDPLQYNRQDDPRTINNPNNPFYDSSIIVLDGGCPVLPTTDPSQLPDGYKVIMIPITKTKDFEILFGLYDPYLL